MAKSTITAKANDGAGTETLVVDLIGTDMYPVMKLIAEDYGTAGTPVSASNPLPTLVTGKAASGAAVSGNPVLVAGSDGTNTQTLRSDTSGRQIIVGAAASGSAVAGNPVLIAASDGTNARTLLSDTSGRQIIAGAAASGSAVTGNPVLIGGSDGTNARTLAVSSSGAASANVTHLGGVAIAAGSGALDSGTQRIVLATDSPGVFPLVSAQTTVTRPANTTAYAAGDIWSDSTSAPTSGGFTFSGMAKAAGKGGVIVGLTVVSTNAPGTVLQAELWAANSAIGNINDNSAFSLSDSDALKVVSKFPFALSNDGVNNGEAFLQNLWVPYVCSGSTNLRFLIKVLNAYTPASAEQLTFTIWAILYD